MFPTSQKVQFKALTCNKPLKTDTFFLFLFFFKSLLRCLSHMVFYTKNPEVQK